MAWCPQCTHLVEKKKKKSHHSTIYCPRCNAKLVCKWEKGVLIAVLLPEEKDHHLCPNCKRRIRKTLTRQIAENGSSSCPRCGIKLFGKYGVRGTLIGLTSNDSKKQLVHKP
jgi:uncharacterized paraquat-inducible protein A